MMDLFTQGYQSYSEGFTELQIKTQPPQFRAGWRTAKADEESKSNEPHSLKNEKVQRFVNKARYTATWQDLESVMRTYPFSNISTVQQLYPIEMGMKQMVWKKRDVIKSYNSLRENLGDVYLQIVDAAYKFKYIDKSDFKHLAVKQENAKFEFDIQQINKVKYDL